MVEQASQVLESILGPLLEAILCECVTMGMTVAYANPQTSLPPAMQAAASAFAAAAAKAAVGTGHVPPPTPPTAPLPRRRSAPPPSLGSFQMRDGGLEAALTELGVPLPPFSALNCLEVLLKLDWLTSAKFPISIRKRLETVSTVSVDISLSSSTLSLCSDELSEDEVTRNLII